MGEDAEIHDPELVSGEVKNEMPVEKTVAEREIDELSKELEEKTRELNEVKDKYLRLYAEFENYKKYITKEQRELLRYGNESLIREILSVVDNLERAISHAEGSNESKGLIDGVEMTLNQLKSILEGFGVTPIKAIGEPFDPSRHHALTQVESEEYDENIVVEEFNKGYYLNERVIRPAFVSVAKKPETRTKD
ncbi:MAG: nucleotide exchange factor GrpE [Nitrospirota bacterium]